MNTSSTKHPAIEFITPQILLSPLISNSESVITKTKIFNTRKLNYVKQKPAQKSSKTNPSKFLNTQLLNYQADGTSQLINNILMPPNDNQNNVSCFTIALHNMQTCKNSNKQNCQTLHQPTAAE